MWKCRQTIKRLLLKGFSVTRSLSSETNPRKELAKEIPENAEVVVNYRSNNLGEAFYEASGTALFRNETSEQIENRKLESTKDPKEEFKKILLEEIRK